MSIDRTAVAAGVRAALPVLLGIVPFGVITGVAMVASGIAPLAAMVMSVIVFAGASMMACAQLLSQGTPALARLAGRSPQHVNALLRTHYGQTATDVLNQARLDYAAVQLQMSTAKIMDICLECGFQNLGHFYRIFRGQFGVTPRAYRLRSQTAVR